MLFFTTVVHRKASQDAQHTKPTTSSGSTPVRQEREQAQGIWTENMTLFPAGEKKPFCVNVLHQLCKQSALETVENNTNGYL